MVGVIDQDFRPIRDTGFSINPQGIVRNDKLGTFLQPQRAKTVSPIYLYSIKGKKSDVNKIMNEVFSFGVSESPNKWFEKTLILIQSEGQKKWHKVPGRPLYITETCDLLIEGGSKIYRPTLPPKGGYYIYRLYIDKRQNCLSVRALYNAVFNKDPHPDFCKRYAMTKAPAPKVEAKINMGECPYGSGKIQPLYGEMDARFSPLDWFHSTLPEAVIVNI